jgi:hypothetical protein
VTHEGCADLAELYALGALDDGERAAMDVHVQECPVCAQLVGAAERDVALIASQEPQRAAPPELGWRIETALTGRRRPSWTIPAAVAAALLVGLLPSMYLWSQNDAMHRAMVAQNAAIERLAAGSHRMAHFQTMPGMPPADVIYAPDGSWYFVVVHGIDRTLSVAWMHDGQRTMLGDAVPRGNIASLYLPKSHPMDRLALMDGDRIVAVATLSWQRTSQGHRAVRSA